ncbi:MAG: MmcQ/YjbR family DNA-binding protein [Bacteroidetes bacterium]|jgi:predicted DNA-binding protein (MmcQ/YjbR family)|nr:MmcQ/YjbR family DNA-binding protein [Bacteroidota bacterium]
MKELDTLQAYALAKPGSEPTMPFGDDALVLKVRGKIWMIIRLDSTPLYISVKCDPAQALELRARYAAVQPGYHLSKKHWNTICLDGSLPDVELRHWIDHSYELVVSALPKKERDTL